MNKYFSSCLFILTALLGCAPHTLSPSSTETLPSPVETDSIIIAVTPFTNLVGKKEYDWLGIGIAEIISTKLGSLPCFQLVERIRLSDALKEMELGQTGLLDENTAARVGQMVGAELLLLGSFQVMARFIRVDARLLEVETGKVYKTAGVTGELDNIFELQDKLAASLVAVVNLPLSGEEKALLEAKPTTSAEAFKLYSRAMDNYTPEGKTLTDDQRINFLEQSTQLDPKFFIAYISLGDIYARRRIDYQRATVYYQKVVHLQPNNPMVRARLVDVYQAQGNVIALHHEKKKMEEARQRLIQKSPTIQMERKKIIEQKRSRIKPQPLFQQQPSRISPPVVSRPPSPVSPPVVSRPRR